MTDKNKTLDFALRAMTNPVPGIDFDLWESVVDGIDRERLEELLAGGDSGLDALFSDDADVNTLLELGLISPESSGLEDDDESQSNVVVFDAPDESLGNSVLATASGRPLSSVVSEKKLAAMTNSEENTGVIEFNAETAEGDRTRKLLELEKLAFANGTVAVLYAAAAQDATFVEFVSEPKVLDFGEGPFELDVIEGDEEIYCLRGHTVMKVHRLLARFPKE